MAIIRDLSAARQVVGAPVAREVAADSRPAAAL